MPSGAVNDIRVRRTESDIRVVRRTESSIRTESDIRMVRNTESDIRTESDIKTESDIRWSEGPKVILGWSEGKD